MEAILSTSKGFQVMNNDELYDISGGVNWLAVVGGTLAVVIGVAAIGAAAYIGAAAGPGGAAIAAKAAAYVVRPLILGGTAAIIGGIVA